jgi:hypothetical protein
VNVAELKIVENKKGNSNHTITATCTATTFVYNEEKDTDEPKAQKVLAKK